MPRHLPLASLLTAALVAATGASAAATEPGDAFDEALLEAKIAEFAEIGGFTVIAEARDGDETWTEAVGDRGLDGGEAAEPDDRVRIASLTKSMISVILLQLQDEGAVDLDGVLGDHLPGLLPYEDEPTIRQILNHTGGLDDYFVHLYPSLLDNDISDVEADHRVHHSPEALVEMSTEGPLLFPPGEQWRYSNTGYMALGLLIEELTGNSLGHELDQRVFEAVGMDDSYLPHDDSSGFRGEHLVPHLSTGDLERPYFDTSELSNTQLWAAGGVIADLADVNDFYRAFADGTLLSEEQLAEATVYVPTGLGFDYGLGLTGFQLGCPDDPEAMHLGHTGGGLGNQTYSFHSADGERQMSFSWNLDDRHYADPAEVQWALFGLLVAGLCGVDIDEEPGAMTFAPQDLMLTNG